MKTKDALTIGIKLGRLQQPLDVWEESKQWAVFVPYVGAHQCSIVNYGPSSSPMGYLASVLSW